MSFFRNPRRVGRLALAVACVGACWGCGTQQEVSMEEALGRPLTAPPGDVDPSQAMAPPIPGGAPQTGTASQTAPAGP